MSRGINVVIDENGGVGGILKGLFGYNRNPSLLEVIAYMTYLLAIAVVWKKVDSK